MKQFILLFVNILGVEIKEECHANFIGVVQIYTILPNTFFLTNSSSHWYSEYVLTISQGSKWSNKWKVLTESLKQIQLFWNSHEQNLSSCVPPLYTTKSIMKNVAHKIWSIRKERRSTNIECPFNFYDAGPFDLSI